jgi:hypothetical protein
MPERPPNDNDGAGLAWGCLFGCGFWLVVAALVVSWAEWWR